MEKAEAANPKRANNKQTKSKKKQPLKVVYITNPIKFTATASEFRGLVQELTGQDADVSDSSRFAAADGGAAKEASAEGNFHAAEGGGGAAAQQKGSFEYDGFFSPESMMIDNFEGLTASHSIWHEDAHVD